MSTSPQIGYYISEFCLNDVIMIESQDDMDYVVGRIKENDDDDCHDLMVFATLAEAIEHYRHDNVGMTREEINAEYARLGWNEVIL